jgi:predicted nucleic acid-binding protein
MQWLYDTLATRFAGRILAIDLETALLWGQLSGEAERRGQPLPAIDTLLAATAIRHELTLVTRNERDFRRMPVTLYNPWQG